MEIDPPTEAPLKSFFYHTIPDFAQIDSQSLISDKNASINSDMTEEAFGIYMTNMYKYSCRFDGLDDSQDYTVSISIELDGKTITQVTRPLYASGSKSPLEKKQLNDWKIHVWSSDIEDGTGPYHREINK